MKCERCHKQMVVKYVLAPNGEFFLAYVCPDCGYHEMMLKRRC